LTGYKIFRGTSSGGETFLASIGPTAPRYLDATADPNTQYFYRVTAVNAIGEGIFCREVQVTAAPPQPTRCAEPYISIATDPAGDQTGDPANTQLDIREISIGEPFLNKCTNQLLFKMKVSDLTVVPPQARWTIFFTRANGTEYFVSMNSDNTGNPTGVVFNYGHTSIGPGGVRQLTTDGVADDGSAFSADGTIFILISNSKLTFNLTPPPATLPPPAPGDTFGNVNAITQQTVGVLLLTVDSTGSGSYTMAGNLSCQPNNPPLAVMSAMPTAGDVPLTVNFNGSASSDPDMCDSVVSYTFDFGDGSLPVTQASPTISHIYNSPGEYSARLKVTDSRARLSDNTAIVIIEGSGPICGVLTPNSQFFGVQGAEGSIVFTALASCSWTAASNASWLEITSSQTGSGSDVVTYIVRDNFAPVPRQGTLIIAGQTFTVVQDSEAAPDCVFSISAAFAAFNASGGAGSLDVITEERCAWQGVSDRSWITITSVSCGIGNGTITYSIGANPGPSGRSGTITLGGKVFAIKQKGQ
jgi:PKD repeat protein